MAWKLEVNKRQSSGEDFQDPIDQNEDQNAGRKRQKKGKNVDSKIKLDDTAAIASRQLRFEEAILGEHPDAAYIQTDKEYKLHRLHLQYVCWSTIMYLLPAMEQK